jgi:hypothetical protein
MIIRMTLALTLLLVLLAAAVAVACTGVPPPVATAPGSQPAAAASTQPGTQPAREQLIIAGEKFLLEVAADDSSRERGLMERDHIDEHSGMLFIYPTPRKLEFWMKNCPIEMDILFVDDHGVITATHRMKAALPRRQGENDNDYDNRLPRYPSNRPAQFAIELRAGTIQRLKIKIGQEIAMDVKRLGAMAKDESE